MSLGAALTFLAATALGAAALGPLARWCVARGCTDPSPRAAVPERKRGQAPQPLAGGAVLFVGVLASFALEAFATPPEMAFVALAGAAGWIDDRRPAGLGPLVKVGAQLVAAVPLAFAWWSAGPLGLVGASGALGALAAAFVALNAVNLFDHADGLVGTLVAVAGCAVGAPLLAGAAAGVTLRQLHPPAAGRPFLGDAGSHLAGAVLLCLPGAWILLAVPLLDALRVVLVRLVAGRSPFEGDRGHLGHLLAARGWSPARQCALLALVLALLVLAARAAG